MKLGVWIPIEVWELFELSLLERYILSDVMSFYKHKRQYFKTNKKLSKECNCSTASITRAITNLIRLDLISLNQISPVRKIVPNQFDEAPNQFDEAPNQIDEAPNQFDEAPNQFDEHISKRISKRRSKVISKIIKGDITYPFQEIEFIEAWKVWILERKEKKLRNYTYRGEQSALHNLQKISGGDFPKAIKIINNSITHGWQGLFKLKNDEQRIKTIDAKSALAWASKAR